MTAEENDAYRYDAFISYSHRDKEWVQDWLLPQLEEADLRVCIDFRDFELGAPSLVNMENAVDRSRKTLLVLTPDWVESEWTEFEALLIQTGDPAGHGRRILPLMVQACELPSRLQVFTYLDLTDPAQFDFQMQRLVVAIRGKEPIYRPSQIKADQLYASACALYDGKHWRDVLDTWERIKQIAPGHPDSRGIVESARAKLKEELGTTTSGARPWGEVVFLALAGIVLGVLSFVALGVDLPAIPSLGSRILLPPPGAIDQVFDKQTGVFLLSSSPDLQIWEISYPRADGITARHTGEELRRSAVEELPVVLEPPEGWKTRPKSLLEQGRISLIDIPPVPQTVNVAISKREGSRNPILLYVFTDAPYLQMPPFRTLPVMEDRIVYEDVHIGQMGVMNFIELEGDEYKITTASNPDIIAPGVGPIAALCAVEFADGKPLARSRVVLVRRQGILHPDDTWFDRERNVPYISSPLGRSNRRKVTFQSLGEDGRQNDVFLADLDGGSVANITGGLPRSENLIIGWGNKLPVPAENNAIYFESSWKGGTRKLLYKVLVYDDGSYSEPIQVRPWTGQRGR